MIKMTKIPDEGSTVYSEQMKAKRNQNKKQMAGFVPICQNADPFLSILLVSENRGYLKQISEALTQLSSKKENSFKVYTCESVTQVLNVSDTPPIDYVAFCVNGNYINSLLEIERNIMKLDRKFLLDRICLICDSALSGGSMQPKILHLKHKYQLHVLWGDLQTESKLVTSRLVNLASAVCGTVSGFPIITQKSWHRKCDEVTNMSAVSSIEDLTF